MPAIDRHAPAVRRLLFALGLAFGALLAGGLLGVIAEWRARR